MTSSLLFQLTNPGTALGGRQRLKSSTTGCKDTATSVSGNQKSISNMTLQSSMQSPTRLFKSDAANNYYNAMKMKKSSQGVHSARSENHVTATNDGHVEFTEKGNCVTLNEENVKTTSVAFVGANGHKIPPASPKQQAEPGVVPPITSFDWSCAGGEREILSTTSSITHCDSFHQTDSFCSVITEEGATAAVAAAEIDTSKNDGRNDDPPITEYPSPVCMSPDDNATMHDSCTKHTLSVAAASSIVPNDLKLDVMEECMGNNAHGANNRRKEPEESIEQDLQSYQASSSITLNGNAKSFKAGNPPVDEISRALNIVDALSVIGSIPKPTSQKCNNISLSTNKVKSVRSMSPSLFKKKAPLSSKNIASLPSSQNTNDTNPSSAPSALLVGKKTVRSMSPSFFALVKNNKDDEKEGNVSDSSTAASTCSTGTNPADDKMEREAKRAAIAKPKSRDLPPLIPARGVDPPHQPRRIITSSDDDGSVECSVDAVADVRVLHRGVSKSADDDEVAGIVTCESSSTNSKSSPEDNASSESSLFYDLESSERTPELGSTGMKGRKEQVKEKLARRRSKASVVQNEDKKSTPNPVTHSMSVQNSNATVTSDASDKRRKKEKLQKIMDYRRKAAPTPMRKLPQKTLDSWLIPKDTQKANESTDKVNTETNAQSKVKSVPTLLNEPPTTGSRKTAVYKARTSKHVNTKTKKTAFVDGNEFVNKAEKNQPHSKYSKPVVHRREISAPVSRIDVLQTAYSTDTGVSLPPELLNEKKVRIWKESETFEDEASKDDNVETLADVFMTCGKSKIDHTDENTIIEEREIKRNNEDESIIDDERNVAFCGVNTRQLKKDIVFEMNEVAREVEDGVRRSMRNLFLTCDITQGGGVEAMTSNVTMTNDQIFGRIPLPTRQLQSVPHKKNENRAVLLSEKKKSDKPLCFNADAKRNMYVAKLKAAALKHM